MAQIIENILKKYGLEKNQEEGLERFFGAETTEQAQEIIDSLPGAVLAQVIRELRAKELSPAKLPEVLQENLGVSPKIAKEIAEGLETAVQLQELSSKPAVAPKKPDVYRESVE